MGGCGEKMSRHLHHATPLYAEHERLLKLMSLLLPMLLLLLKLLVEV